MTHSNTGPSDYPDIHMEGGLHLGSSPRNRPPASAPKPLNSDSLQTLVPCHRQPSCPHRTQFDDHVVTVESVCLGRGVHPSASGSPDPADAFPRASNATWGLRALRASRSPSRPASTVQPAPRGRPVPVVAGKGEGALSLGRGSPERDDACPGLGRVKPSVAPTLASHPDVPRSAARSPKGPERVDGLRAGLASRDPWKPPSRLRERRRPPGL